MNRATHVHLGASSPSFLVLMAVLIALVVQPWPK